MRPSRMFHRLALIALAWLLIAGLLLLQLWPDLPTSRRTWILLLTLGPPLYLTGEALGERLLSRQRGMALSPRRVSLLRMMLALPLVLVGMLLSLWLSQALGNA